MRRTFWTFAVFISMLFLVMGVILNFIAHDYLDKVIEEKVQRDVRMLTVISQGAEISNNFERIEEDLMVWFDNDPKIIILSMQINDDNPIIEFDKDIETEHYYQFEHSILSPSGRNITFVMKYNLTDHKKDIVVFTWIFLLIACILTFVFIIILWMILKYMAIKPLQNEIAIRKKTEVSLSEANTILNRSPVVVFLWKNDKDWSVKFVTDNVKKLSGYSKQDFIDGNISYSKIIHKDDVNKVFEEVAKYSKIEGLISFTHKPYRIIAENGDIKWIEDVTHIRRDSKGTITYYEGIVFDITARVEAKNKFEDSEKRYHGLIDSTSEGFWWLASDNKTIDANQSLCRMLGYSLEEIIGKSPADFVDAANNKIFKKQMSQRRKTKHRTFEISLKRKDGTNVQTLFKATTLQDRNGKINGCFALITEMTKLKKLKDELQQSEQKFKDLVEKSNIAILIEDKDGNFTYFNESFHKLFGYTADEIKKTSNSDLVHPDDFKKVMGYHNKRINGEKVPSDYEHRAIKKDGSIIYLSLNVIPTMEDNKIVGTHSYIWDITDRKQAELELIKHRDHLEELVEERTSELEDKNTDLQRFFDATVDRELRMKELNGEVETLKNQLKK